MFCVAVIGEGWEVGDYFYFLKILCWMFVKEGECVFWGFDVEGGEDCVGGE